jgi:hypothetical protein
MVITNFARASSSFDHIMDNVLGRSNLNNALLDEGIKDISHVSTLKDDALDGLQ